MRRIYLLMGNPTIPMKQLSYNDIFFLNTIADQLSSGKPLSHGQSRLLESIKTKWFRNYTEPFNKVQVANKSFIKAWISTFAALPGFSWCTRISALDKSKIELPYVDKIVIYGVFYPSLRDKLSDNDESELFLLDDGNAILAISTSSLNDETIYLAEFKGSWHEAYKVVVSALSVGWPLNLFPEELRQEFTVPI